MSSPLAAPKRTRSRQADAVRVQVPDDPVNAPAALKDVKDQLQRLAHALIGIQHDLPGGATQETARQVEAEFAALGLVPASFLEAGAHDVQLGFAHRALQSQQKPVVVNRGIVNPVVVANERAG
jgi:hypothetical protein